MQNHRQEPSWSRFYVCVKCTVVTFATPIALDKVLDYRKLRRTKTNLNQVPRKTFGVEQRADRRKLFVKADGRPFDSDRSDESKGKNASAKGSRSFQADNTMILCMLLQHNSIVDDLLNGGNN